MREQTFRALAVSLATEDAAAKRCPNGHRTDEVAGGTVAQSRRFADQLIEAWVDIIRKLDLRHRAQTVSCHANADANDAAFSNRRIEHARLAMLFL